MQEIKDLFYRILLNYFDLKVFYDILEVVFVVKLVIVQNYSYGIQQLCKKKIKN